MAFDAVTEQAYADLLERETLVQELTESPGWQALKEVAAMQMDAKRRQLLGGRLDSHEDYLKVAFWLQGAEEVFALPSHVHKMVDEYRLQLAEANAQAALGEDGQWRDDG